MSSSKPIEPQQLPERRRAIRFPGDSQVHYRVLSKDKQEKGSGRVIDISSHGIRFAADKILTAGTRLVLSVDWPVWLNGRCPLQLVIHSRVVRYRDGVVAARFESREFRTRRPNNGDEHSRVPNPSKAGP